MPRIGEAEVVPGYQLKAVLQKWTVEYLARHSNTRLDQQTGPVQYLAAQSGINVRRVSGICNGEFIVVPLTQADALLMAIERPDILGIEVQIVPNPNWSFEAWLEYMQERGCVY